MSHSIFNDSLFSGKVALVTGGATGIGAEIAFQLASLGAKVIIASRKAEKIEAAAAGLTKLTNTTVEGIPCDIRDREVVKETVEKIVNSHGQIDILINNGGGQFMSPAEYIRPKGWDAVIATNLTGTWNLTQQVAQQSMLKNGGSIINITMLTDRGFPGMTHSVAARAGVEAMTKTLSIEWALKNIRVNSVQPGIIASSGMRNYPHGEAIAAQTRPEIPMKRLGTCTEVAHLCLFLASDAARYITGQIWAVDGGRSLWGKQWPLPNPKEMEPVIIPTWPWEE
jgi:NAD(P)-dependent dehydrogenase (short-subunit alcohol dehydrogenase family)